MSGPVVAVHGGKFGDALLAGLRAFAPATTFVPAGSPDSADRAEVLATLADDAEAIERVLAEGVTWVHVLGAGVDGFPLEVASGRTLTCSRGAGAPAIAEFVLASMLAFEKRLPDSWITSPPTTWNTADLGGLAGRSLGIVGLGAIGSAVAARAVAFEMDVLALRRSDRPIPVHGVGRAVSLAELLGGSDHIVLAAPATPATHHLLDEDALHHVRHGAHLVNVARGSLVDQEALLAALDEGRLALASLDVVEPEPLPEGHPFYTHPRVHLSPHISWSSPATPRRTFELFAENLERYRSGRPLVGVVDLEAGY